MLLTITDDDGATVLSVCLDDYDLRRSTARDHLIDQIIVATTRTKKCPSCSGHGFQSGAHTERVVPCPRCGGAGYDEPAADRHLRALLTHLEGEWALIAVTPDEVATLRAAGYIAERGTFLTDAGRAKLAELRGEVTLPDRERA